MVWTPLRERINQLPLVLAGPIVRCVTKDAVTVWVALKDSKEVTLEIFDTNKTKLIQGTRNTTKVGENLHIVAVTASYTSDFLSNGQDYLYDLYFGDGKNLSSPGVITSSGSITDITYSEYELPSFPVTPNSLDDLRIVHGSCRKPHGESIDAMASLDKMIAEALSLDKRKRPHQLFLTGDQIYADDVADVLLFMLMDAAQTLLGWSEHLPDIVNDAQLEPGQRNDIATNVAGLTGSIGKIGNISNLCKSHLFAFGEYCAMYLFAWSDVLWMQPEDFPDLKLVHDEQGFLQDIFGKVKSTFEQESKYIKEFWQTLKPVRRALANLPTYMIFDDHEITDDWYLNVAWCDRILTKPLGRRILQNGMLAYALFQGWGNTPEQFEGGESGELLLQALERWTNSVGKDSTAEKDIYQYLGLPELTDIHDSQPKKLPSSQKALKWHYIVNGSGYEVLVLDTRTRRSFPGAEFDFPALLSQEACEEQILHFPQAAGAKVTMVISPGPVIGLPFLESIQKVAKNISEKFGKAAWGFDTEAWALEDAAFERLLSKLALRGSSKEPTRAIILSGDVHYSFSARLQYCAQRPFESEEESDNLDSSSNSSSDSNSGSNLNKSNTELLIVQFTSSSLKNEVKGAGGSHSLHIKGFVPLSLITDRPTSEVLGWENQPQEELHIGVCYNFVDDTLQNIPLKTKNNPAKVDLVKKRGTFREIEITKAPQWWYRVDFLNAKLETEDLPNSYFSGGKSAIAPLPKQDRSQFLADYLAMVRNSRDFTHSRGHGKEIVGVNNIAEITFETVAGKPVAVQTLWWRLESREKGKLLEPFPLTRCEVSLDLFDPEHPMNDVLKEVIS